MGRKLLQNFLCSFNAPVWNIISHPERPVLFVETRNEADLRATFHALEMKHGKFLWRDLLLDESWWVGISGVLEDVLLFHTYQDGSSPEKKQLIGYDFQHKKELWRISGFSWSQQGKGVLLGSLEEAGERKPAMLHVRSGKIEEIGANAPLAIEPLSGDENIGIQYPFHYTEESEHYSTVAEFLKIYIKSHPVKALEYLEFKDLVAISYYLYQGEKLANFLLVMDTRQEIQLHEKLQEALDGVGMNTFFIMEEWLIYVKQKNQIVAHTLS